MTHILYLIGQALLMALAMFWKVGWSLVLGFTVQSADQLILAERPWAVENQPPPGRA